MDSTLIMSLRVPCAFSAWHVSKLVTTKVFFCFYKISLYALDWKLAEGRCRACFCFTLFIPSTYYIGWFTAGLNLCRMN